ncbi:unnamed protein product [Owenia fusiformis]|uniref:UBZ2-type domain-containing protein n=1 Tax=Owenia fusiformis TaxID=6347 RepID=A0A8S4N3V6_OWEFU|nr:unnamed protein product [Owenia fusiformis]
MNMDFVKYFLSCIESESNMAVNLKKRKLSLKVQKSKTLTSTSLINTSVDNTNKNDKSVTVVETKSENFNPEDSGNSVQNPEEIEENVRDDTAYLIEFANKLKPLPQLGEGLDKVRLVEANTDNSHTNGKEDASHESSIEGIHFKWTPLPPPCYKCTFLRKTHHNSHHYDSKIHAIENSSASTSMTADPYPGALSPTPSHNIHIDKDKNNSHEDIDSNVTDTHKQEDAKAGHPHISPHKDDMLLQNCPLCGLGFPRERVNQMEIDSHIATCLASADDDTNW